MTYAPRPNEFVPFFQAPTASMRPARKPRRLLHRILDALFVSPEQQAEREATRYIARAGGRLTDDIERQITDHILGGSWRY